MMAKGVRVKEGVTLVLYNTKITPEARALLLAIGQVEGKTQRELVEDLIAYIAVDKPETVIRAKQLLELTSHSRQDSNNPEPDDFVDGDLEEDEDMEAEEPDPAPPAAPVPTIKYVGRPQVHLYENGKAACGLSGQIDEETLQEQHPDAVDCKKCRYCRKAVFS